MSLAVVSNLHDASRLEADGHLSDAAKIYEQVIKTKTLEEQPYSKLMIIYRKLKQPKDELRVIKSAISVFESKYLKKSRSKKLTDLSNALIKSSGLGNGKGKLYVYPEPLGKWYKRKDVVEKKLKK